MQAGSGARGCWGQLGGDGIATAGNGYGEGCGRPGGLDGLRTGLVFDCEHVSGGCGGRVGSGCSWARW